MDNYHIPVLLKEAISSLNIIKDNKYIDATLGGGGHTEEILRLGGSVLALDVDDDAINNARKRLTAFLENIACPVGHRTVPDPGPQSPLRTLVLKPGAFSQNNNTKLKLAKGNFSDIENIAKNYGFEKVNGILYDLGVSTHQLEIKERGFSFNSDAPLDMRMDNSLKVTASDLVNVLNEGELYELFTKLGEEYSSRAIARSIIRARKIKPINTCNELARIIVSAHPQRGKYDRTHPATRIFQALRIAVNDELNNLKISLPQAIKILNKNGRIVVISFHSLEDRIVKNYFKDKEKEGILKILTKKPIRPTFEEIERNPRSRSAKLRVAEKII